MKLKEFPLIRTIYDLHARSVHIEQKINELLARTDLQPKAKVDGTDQVFGPTTYSQCGEDLIVANVFALLGIKNPTYLDIGGHMPWIGSNTALFYLAGSHGVVIDANPDIIPVFKNERPDDTVVNVGVAAHPGVLPFYRIDSFSGRNTFSKEAAEAFVALHPKFKITDVIDVPVQTLDQIVAQHCNGTYPDFLTIDAEAKDFEILKSADLSASRPKVICTETITGADVETFGDLTGLLRSRGYTPYARTWGNAIYVDENTSRFLAL